MMYDAVMRSDLALGLATALLTQVQLSRVDAFQLRRLRQMPKLRHSCKDRSNTHARVLEVANSHWFPKGYGINIVRSTANRSVYFCSDTLAVSWRTRCAKSLSCGDSERRRFVSKIG